MRRTARVDTHDLATGLLARGNASVRTFLFGPFVLIWDDGKPPRRTVRTADIFPESEARND